MRPVKGSLFRERDLRFSAGLRTVQPLSLAEQTLWPDCKTCISVLRQTSETLKGLILLVSPVVAKLTLCATVGGLCSTGR